MKPEEVARQQIDEMLVAAGWVVQDRQEINLSAGLGIAIREFSLRTGAADYFLMVNRLDCTTSSIYAARPSIRCRGSALPISSVSTRCSVVKKRQTKRAKQNRFAGTSLSLLAR